MASDKHSFHLVVLVRLVVVRLSLFGRRRCCFIQVNSPNSSSNNNTDGSSGGGNNDQWPAAGRQRICLNCFRTHFHL
jgi:hypothetical protein